MRSKLLMMLSAAFAVGNIPALNQFSGLSRGATPNKFKPHQGKKECARRVRQMQKAAE